MSFSFVDEQGLHSASEIEAEIQAAVKFIDKDNAVIIIESERSLQTAIRFSACLKAGRIPFLLPSEEFRNAEFLQYARSSIGKTSLWKKDSLQPEKAEGETHEHLKNTTRGFIVKTSGTSGMKNKFVLHGPELFVKKFSKRPPSFEKTLNFFPPDSIAGVELLLEATVHGKCIVNPGLTPDPSRVVKMISSEKIDYLHVTPTFLNMLLVSGDLDSASLSAVKVLAYGSEPAQKSVLEKVRDLNPKINFVQIYGMSEIGLQKTFPVTNNPEMFCLDTNVNAFKLQDGMLIVKSESPMICYLNNSAKVENGWFSTGDSVEENQGLLRVIGRSDDVINVAGKKFHPIQLEELLMGMDEIDDVMITAEPHELIGHSVTANISTRTEEKEFRKKLRDFIEANIPSWMRPQKILLNPPSMSTRLKKRRKTSVG